MEKQIYFYVWESVYLGKFISFPIKIYFKMRKNYAGILPKKIRIHQKKNSYRAIMASRLVFQLGRILFKQHTKILLEVRISN